MQSVPQGDGPVYDMLCLGDSVGTFQVESRAQMSMLPRLKPTSFYDLVIEVAIVRPGPIQGGMVHPYLRRRAGEEPSALPSPALEPALACVAALPQDVSVVLISLVQKSSREVVFLFRLSVQMLILLVKKLT